MGTFYRLYSEFVTNKIFKDNTVASRAFFIAIADVSASQQLTHLTPRQHEVGVQNNESYMLETVAAHNSFMR